MKNFFRTIALGAILSMALTACSTSDADKDYGYPKIYIPQASTTGLDNSYPIPAGPIDQYSTYSCRINGSTGALEIALGVNRSGFLSKQEAFSVKLSLCTSETERKLAEYEAEGTPAQALPSNLVTIPEKISVEEGSHSGTCYVSVDLNALAAQSASLMDGGAYKLLVAGLEISEPSRYELADNYTKVVIVIDLNSTYWDEDVRSLFPLN